MTTINNHYQFSTTHQSLLCRTRLRHTPTCPAEVCGNALCSHTAYCHWQCQLGTASPIAGAENRSPPPEAEKLLNAAHHPASFLSKVNEAWRSRRNFSGPAQCSVGAKTLLACAVLFLPTKTFLSTPASALHPLWASGSACKARRLYGCARRCPSLHQPRHAFGDSCRS